MLPDEEVPFAYRFLRADDDAYWQVSDPDRVWSVVRDDNYENVENPDFLFASGLSLAASGAALFTALVSL